MQEEDYQSYQEKYNLPKFNELEDEFDLLQADSEYPLKAVRKQMQDKVDFLITILADVLQPSPDSVQQMHECTQITEEEKNTALDIYKQLNFLLRAINQSQLENNEEQTANTVKLVATQWPSLKQQALPILTKLKESWKKNLLTHETAGYFG